MKILIEYNTHDDIYIIKFIYAGIVFYAPLEQQGDMSLSAELLEKPIADLMNLCIQELKDIKQQKLAKHQAEEGSIKFYGVDYS